MEFELGRMPLVAILRGLTPQEAPDVGRTLFDAGFRLLEVPLNRPGALEAMQAVRRVAPSDAIIGGGTMLTVKHVEDVHAAGGRMMVSPNCNTAVIERAVRLGMLALPGVATPTEAYAALEAGAHALKLFPAEMIGPGVVKALRSVLPAQVLLMPVGGILPSSIQDYAQAGAGGFGIGSALYKPAGSLEDLRRAADEFMTARSILMAGV